MTESLISTALSVACVLVSGCDLGTCIEAFTRREYKRAGVYAMFSVYFMLAVAKILFCW